MGDAQPALRWSIRRKRERKSEERQEEIPEQLPAVEPQPWLHTTESKPRHFDSQIITYPKFLEMYTKTC